MKAAKIAAVVVAAVALVALGALYRVPDLADRPLHGDEAVNTFKFKALYEDNAYQYDPEEYHGPTLPYLTLIAAWVDEATEFEAFEPPVYRSVTVAFGLLLIVATVALGPGIGYGAAIFAALFIAVSPAMAFYSRYYIHEMPLVVFTLLAILAGWRYAVTRRLAWALALGVALALMHATKETAIISWFAAAVATLVLLVIHHRRELNLDTAGDLLHAHGRAAAVALVAWVIVAVVLFSSFFTHARGPLDAVTTFLSYLDRGTGGEPLHVHPWYYYLSLLGWQQPIEPLIWSEALTLGLAAIGTLAALVGKGIGPRHLPLVRWLVVYTLTLIVVYSAIPYKTPWSMLSFHHGLLILAGVGAAVLVWAIPYWIGSAFSRKRPALVAAPLAVIVLIPLGWATYQLTTQTERTVGPRFGADPRNPYVYAHPTRRVVELGEKLEAVASLHPQGMDMPVLVYDHGNYWPLPWYLRNLNRVGFFPSPPPEDVAGPVILVNADMEHESRLFDRIGDTHAGPQITSIRPEHIVYVYIEKDLYERYRDTLR